MKMLPLWGGEVAPLKGIFHSISHSPAISLTQDGGRPGAGGFLLLMWRKSVTKCWSVIKEVPKESLPCHDPTTLGFWMAAMATWPRALCG